MTQELSPSGEAALPPEVALPPAELLREMVKALVDQPGAVRIVQSAAEGSASDSLLLIHVAPDDRGKVIGKQGATITALRTLFGRIAASLGIGSRLFIEVADSKGQRERL